MNIPLNGPYLPPSYFVYRGMEYKQGLAFMKCKSCWEVTCRISGYSDAHSYRVICEFPPTTNLLVLRGCHRSLLSDWNIDIDRNVPLTTTNTADETIIWLYVDKHGAASPGPLEKCLYMYMQLTQYYIIINRLSCTDALNSEKRNWRREVCSNSFHAAGKCGGEGFHLQLVSQDNERNLVRDAITSVPKHVMKNQ